MKKFLEDKPLKIQSLPDSDKYFPFKPPDHSNRFIVLWTNRNNVGQNYQVIIQDIPEIENNYYKVIVFDNDDNAVRSFLYHSHVIIPPVADRKFGIEYSDYLMVQKTISDLSNYSEISDYNYLSFNIDYDSSNKIFNMVIDENAYQKAKNREQYQTLSVFANKKPDWVEWAQKFPFHAEQMLYDVRVTPDMF